MQVALLTIYDMCKSVDRAMSIHDVRVVEKHGGKSGSRVTCIGERPMHHRATIGFTHCLEMLP